MPADLSGQVHGSVIKGKVTDTMLNPLEGAAITIQGTFRGVYSGPDGSFAIGELKDGHYSMSFSFIGYESITAEVVLKGEAFVEIAMVQKQIMAGEVIVNATRAGNNSPMAYSNLKSDELKKLNAGQDLPFLLSLTPSLVETSESGTGIGYTSLRIRGTDASRINVTIDGIPLNDPESQQVFWVDLPDLASSVDNIQVQRGVGTSSNGAGAFGASINIQTKGIENEPFAEIHSTAGSFSTFKNSVAAGTGLLAGKFAMQMRLSDLRSNGFVSRTGSEHQSAYISGVYRSAKSMLKANLLFGKEHTGIGWWGVPQEKLAVDRRYNPAGEYTDENGIIQYYDNESDNYVQNHYQLIYNLKISDKITANAAIHYTRGEGYYEEFKEDRLLNDYGLTVFDPNGLVIRESDLIRRKWMANDFYGAIWSMKYTDRRYEASFGGGMNLFSGDHFGRIIWMRYAGNTDKDYQWYFNNGHKGEASLFSKLSYSLTENLTFFGDLQYRHINYELSGNDDDLKDISQVHRYNFINPKAGLFFKTDEHNEVFVSFSVAGREPTRTDFKEAAGDPDAMPHTEKLFDTEAGYKFTGEKLLMSFNLFWMNYRDQLVPTGELSSTGYPIQTNVERSYRTGIELGTGLLISGSAGWDANITLSRNKITDFTEYYTDYNTSDWTQEYKSRKLGTVDLAYSPEVIAGSDLWFKPHRMVAIHLIGKYVGKQYFDNTMNETRKLDPYFVNNIRVDISNLFGRIRNSELQIFVNNVFNAEYESNAYGGNWFEDGIEKTWAYYFPQAGTNFMVRFGLKF